MIQLTLTRHNRDAKAVRGTLTFPLLDREDTFSVPTLENADHLIPDGTYKVERTWSPKFRKFLPELLEVPERTGIRIHRGTLTEHSLGCILLDMTGMANLDILFNQLSVFEIDEEVQIQIISSYAN